MIFFKKGAIVCTEVRQSNELRVRILDPDFTLQVPREVARAIWSRGCSCSL